MTIGAIMGTATGYTQPEKRQRWIVAVNRKTGSQGSTPEYVAYTLYQVSLATIASPHSCYSLLYHCHFLGKPSDEPFHVAYMSLGSLRKLTG